MPAIRESDLVFSRHRYEARRGEVRLHMSHFFLQYLHDLYEAFEGDLALAIVLGEISHHNTAHFFCPNRHTNEPVRTLQHQPAAWTRMPGCNAYSVSCATGIPRETVRRKVQTLIKRGWVEKVPRKGLRFTQACADHFGPDYSLRFLNGLLRASRHIEALLAGEETTPLADNARPAQPTPKSAQPETKAAPPARKAAYSTRKAATPSPTRRSRPTPSKPSSRKK